MNTIAIIIIIIIIKKNAQRDGYLNKLKLNQAIFKNFFRIYYI